MTNHFDSKDGEQNIAQGDGATGKQVNVTQEVRGDGCIFSGTGPVTVNGIPPALFAQYVKELGATEQVIQGFLGTLLKEKVPRDQWDSKLREIAATHKELLARVGGDQAAKQAIEAGDYAKAEALLEDAAKQHSISAAETYAELADLQRVQLRYAKAAAYWQKAAALLPEDEKKERSLYLHEAGHDLDCIASYTEALSLYEQSLRIRQNIGFKAGEGVTLNNISQIYTARGDYLTALNYLEQSLRIRQDIGDKAGEGQSLNNIATLHYSKGDYEKALPLLEQSLTILREVGGKTDEAATLNNISQIYSARGDYGTALKYLEQSLVICQELGNKAGEGTTLNNLATTAYAQGDYTTALKYFEQSLVISQEIGDRAVENATLNNISLIYDARGDYPAALKYLEQSLSISREIGDKAGEVVTSWNTGLAYIRSGDLRKAEPYISRAVQLAEELGHPKLKEWREGLKLVRAKLKTQ
jgi:tetratricopeptide (TPR) repeat protein